ncbi:hypothetical protein [Halopelagius fulvigenes]|uniref:Uncharacterized protein n=1 Tax=Halopelagius fulvigenes TaxID=1198324 RepID=A0ABD5TYJ4_9EURY
MPKQYASRAALERELDYSPLDFGIESETDWNDLLDESLQTATERVDGWTTSEHTWTDADDAPYTISEAVIRLARARILRIHEDGIASEDLVSGAGYDYRSPKELHADIKGDLRDMGYRRLGGGSRHITSTNFSDS